MLFVALRSCTSHSSVASDVFLKTISELEDILQGVWVNHCIDEPWSFAALNMTEHEVEEVDAVEEEKKVDKYNLGAADLDKVRLIQIIHLIWISRI